MTLLKLQYSGQLLFFTYLFLAVCSCSPDSIIIYLLIFLSLSYSLLFMASWWLSYPYRCFLPFLVTSKYLHALSLMPYSYDLKNPRPFCILHQILWDNGTVLFKSQKTGTVLGKPWQMGSPVEVQDVDFFYTPVSTVVVNSNAQDYECSHSKGWLIDWCMGTGPQPRLHPGL
jgi:hypothetical protein